MNAEEFYSLKDTKTGEEKYIGILLQKFQEKFVKLHNNPTDQCSGI